MEKWKPIKGTGRKYSVSTMGRVKNNSTNQILKQQLRINGTSVYSRINLPINGVKKWIYMQVLVKHTFEPIENPELFDIDHWDWNSLNNCLHNLKYSSKIENQKRKLKSSDSYKLFKSLVQVFGDEEMYRKLKSINYVQDRKEIIVESL